MLELTQECNLAQDALAVGLILEDVVDLFDGNAFPRCQLDGLRHLAIATLAKHLFQFVVTVYIPLRKAVLLLKIERQAVSGAGTLDLILVSCWLDYLGLHYSTIFKFMY